MNQYYIIVKHIWRYKIFSINNIHIAVNLAPRVAVFLWLPMSLKSLRTGGTVLKLGLVSGGWHPVKTC